MGAMPPAARDQFDCPDPPVVRPLPRARRSGIELAGLPAPAT